MNVQVNVADPSIALTDDGYPFLAYLRVENNIRNPFGHLPATFYRKAMPFLIILIN